MKADSLFSVVALGPVPDVKHNFYYQGYRALRRQFGIPNSEAHTIVAACPDCQGQHIPTYYGTNPHGL